MRALLVTLALLLALPASAGVSGSSKPGQLARIACLGDSLTSGEVYTTVSYPTGLQTALGSGATVRNLAVQGYTASQIATVYTTNVDGKRWKWLVLLGGINDVRTGALTGTAAYNVLDPIVDDAVSEGTLVLWIRLLPWKNNAGWTAGRQTETDAFNTLVSARTDVRVLDAKTALGNVADRDQLAAAYDAGDGLHLNDAGAAALAAAVRGAMFP